MSLCNGASSDSGSTDSASESVCQAETIHRKKFRVEKSRSTSQELRYRILKKYYSGVRGDAVECGSGDKSNWK